MAPSLPLRTDRLVLRPVYDGDLPRLFAILGDPEVMKLALYERALTRDEAQQFIDDDFTTDVADVTHLAALCRSDDETVIGFAGLLPCKYLPGELEMGFVLAAEHHRKGYATEIGVGLINLAFRGLGCERVLALCSPRNDASRAVLEKLGMSRINEISTTDRGARLVYEIRQTEWTGVLKRMTLALRTAFK
jgi:[ribosomal protein S5]-alanine N-acetyltransferase